MPDTTFPLLAVHRVLRVGNSGPDVTAVQDAANRRLHARNLDRYVCAVDGEFGPKTLLACQKAEWALGALKATLQRSKDTDSLSIGAQRIIRSPDEYRTAANLTIARARIHEATTHEHAQATASPIKIAGNTVTGGDGVHRLVAAAQHSMWLWETGRSRRYYSQAGSWDVDHALTGPAPGHRDDCSSWFIGIYKACGLPDPAGTGYSYGNTATLWDHGREVSEADALPGDGVIYGTSAASSHHIEFLYKAPVTIGHGDAAVNRGTVHEMGNAHFFRFDR